MRCRRTAWSSARAWTSWASCSRAPPPSRELTTHLTLTLTLTLSLALALALALTLTRCSIGGAMESVLLPLLASLPECGPQP